EPRLDAAPCPAQREQPRPVRTGPPNGRRPRRSTGTQHRRPAGGEHAHRPVPRPPDVAAAERAPPPARHRRRFLRRRSVRRHRALNRKGIALFAADSPHDYPEVEATVMCVKHKLRLTEVPVSMRERGGGASSITAFRSIYYMTKVLLAIFVGLFRRYAVPFEEEHRR